MNHDQIGAIYSGPCKEGIRHTIVIFTNGSAAWSCTQRRDALQFWPNLRNEA